MNLKFQRFMFIKSAKAFYSPIALFKDEAKSARFFPVKNGSEVQEGKKKPPNGRNFSNLLVFVASVFSVELFDTSLCGCEALTSSVEWMAVAASIYAKSVTFHSRSGFEFIASGRANNSNGMVIRMNSLFHASSSFRLKPSAGLK